MKNYQSYCVRRESNQPLTKLADSHQTSVLRQEINYFLNSFDRHKDRLTRYESQIQQLNDNLIENPPLKLEKSLKSEWQAKI